MSTKEGIKLDNGKLRWDLLPLEAIEAVVEVMTFGANKYTPNGWKTVPDAEDRYFAAQMRHSVTNRQKQELVDPESGLLHLAHEACNAVFRLQLKLEQIREANGTTFE